jgi:hypothetical protein
MNYKWAHSPPREEGWPRHQKCTRSEKARTGWSLSSHVYGNRYCENPYLHEGI